MCLVFEIKFLEILETNFIQKIVLQLFLYTATLEFFYLLSQFNKVSF